MANSNFFRGSPLLMGDNTTPGLRIPEELLGLIPQIKDECKEFGLDTYPTVVQMLTYDEISEVAAYGGFPVRFPHWKWGMEYEELQRGYEHGMHRIFEMVINTNPCYIYCLDSNTVVDNVTVIAHALGHNDFFKNNIYFAPTSDNALNQLANHGTRIRRYMARWGKEKVQNFIDNVLRIETLIDPHAAWERKVYHDPVIHDTRKYIHPARLPVKDGHEHMEPYINPDEWRREQNERIERQYRAEELEIFAEPTRDVMKFIRDHANLKPWQSDIVAMIYEEAMYFAPQRTTKMLNEGWASYVDHNIMAKRMLCGLGQDRHDCGIVEYAIHKMGVLGGKYSMNPYKLGFTIFSDIEERWDKGRFGREYEDCDDARQREDWDTHTGLGHEKVLEVRKFYNDFTVLAEFFTDEFCTKYEFFEWKKYPNGEYRIECRDPKRIRKKLIRRHLNGGLPEIKLVDPNHRNLNYLFLQHIWDGRPLLPGYAHAVLQSLCFLWGKPVILATRSKDGEEIVYICFGSDDDQVMVRTRKDYEQENGKIPPPEEEE